MPLVNVFLWMILLLVALFVYQMLKAYEYEENQAQKQLARIKQLDSRRMVTLPLAAPSRITHQTSGIRFMDIGKQTDILNSRGDAGPVECFVINQSTALQNCCQKDMAAEDSCHICA